MGQHRIVGSLVGLVLTICLGTSCGSADSASTTSSSGDTSVAPETAETTTAPVPTTDGGPDTFEAPEATEISRDITLGLTPLPVATERHQEGEPAVGLIAPSLVAPGVVVPSDQPTLILVAAGSCADCEAAAQRLTSLAAEYDAVAIVIGPEDTPIMPEPWVVVASDDVARAFGGRARPTALVLGLEGELLSRVRPYNREGTEYDTEDIRFGLQIATNQMRGSKVGQAASYLKEPRLGPLPDSFFAIEIDGDAVEVNSSTGEVLNRIPGLGVDDDEEIQSQVFDDLVSIPNSDQLLLSECCEPAAGFMGLLSGWNDFDLNSRVSGFNAWEVSPGPDGRHLAFSGYVRFVYEVGSEPVGIDDTIGASNGSNPDVAWLRDRLGVAYLHRGNVPAVVEIIEFDADYLPISRRNFELQGPASAFDVNADGNLVVVVNPPAGQAASGQVYDPNTGELMAEFALEAGVFDLDYDVSGRFLAYVDRDGIARWQGGGNSGVLGEGYRAISW